MAAGIANTVREIVPGRRKCVKAFFSPILTLELASLPFHTLLMECTRCWGSLVHLNLYVAHGFWKALGVLSLLHIFIVNVKLG